MAGPITDGRVRGQLSGRALVGATSVVFDGYVTRLRRAGDGAIARLLGVSGPPGG